MYDADDEGYGSSDQDDGKKKGKKKIKDSNDADKNEEDEVIKKPEKRPKLPIKSKKLGTLKAALDRQAALPEDDVIMDATPLNYHVPGRDFDPSHVETCLKIVRTKLEKTFRPTPVTGKRRKRQRRVKIIGPKPTQQKPKASFEGKGKMERYLEPPRVTYLRPRPDGITRTSYQLDYDPEVPMGPPNARVFHRKPCKTVKVALTFLKDELGITTPEELEFDEYSLHERVRERCFTSVEQVITELDFFVRFLPKKASSDYMKERLLEFQTCLGMSPWPNFYNLIWKSAEAFKNYLTENLVVKEESGSQAGNGRLPPPTVPFYEAMEIVYAFVNRHIRQEDVDEINEVEFTNLQADLELPEWVRLIDLYRYQTMQGLIEFLADHFQSSKFMTLHEWSLEAFGP